MEVLVLPTQCLTFKSVEHLSSSKRAVTWLRRVFAEAQRWRLCPGYSSIKIWNLIPPNIKSHQKSLYEHAPSEISQSHFMEPVRQCPVRPQIERTKAKAASSQNHMQLAVHHIQPFWPRKTFKNTNQQQKPTTHPSLPYGHRGAWR